MIRDTFYKEMLNEIQERHRAGDISTNEGFDALMKLLIMKENVAWEWTEFFWDDVKRDEK